MKYAILTGLVFMAACTHQQTTEELLKNNDSRHNIMQAISNDHDLANEMLNNLANSPASADLVKSNCEFMKSEKGGALIKKDTAMRNMIISNYLFLLNHDSVLCDKTCTQMSLNPSIYRVLGNNRNTTGK
jgi:hypothetical protein